MINREYERILNSSKCDYFEDLIETVFITNIKILSSVQINSNDSVGLQVNIPSPVHFIHKCYIESAKEIYKNPYVFENSKNMTPKEKHTNIRDSLTYIDNSINSAIRELLPIRDILKQGITKQNSSVSNNIIGGSSTSDEKTKTVEYSSAEEEEDEEDEEEEEITEATSVSESLIEKDNDEKSEIIENKEISIINNDLLEEKSVKNDYVSQISDVSETDEIVIKDDPQKTIIGGSSHLFDKLSKNANVASSGGSIKQIQMNNEINPIPNIVRPVIIPDNRPPEIKEIFIGKQNINNSSNPNFFSLKPKENRHNGLLIRNKLHNSDKTNSLYKKKYDEYVKNSQVNSSSINNTEQKSLSSVKSNSKTIVLEDASEYISDNIEF
jgi:hypothetical protein